MEDIAARIGEPPLSIPGLLEAVSRARGMQSSSKVSLYISGGLAAALLAAATGGVALAAAPGLAGAATLTSGLAGLGALVGGGMAAGIGVVGASSAGSLGAAVVALRSMSAQQVRSDVIKLHAVAQLKQAGGIGDHGVSERDLLERLKTEAAERYREHCVTDDDDDKSTPAKEWKKKRDALRRALKDLG